MINFIRKYFPRFYCKHVEKGAIKFNERLKVKGVDNKHFEASMLYGIAKLVALVLLLYTIYLYLTGADVENRYTIGMVSLLAILGMRICFLVFI